MLFAVLAMVGCGDDPEETTTAAPGTTATTGTSNTTGTTATTSDTTTSGTTATTSDTTTSDTTTSDTTEPPETTSSEPADDTTITSGTTVPLYARFDFGTDTKAEAEGKTSHEYIVSILTYDSSSLTIEFTEDTMVIWATKSYTSGMDTGAFAICFDNIVTYDFDEQQAREMIDSVSEEAQAKIDWNKVWSKKYPVLATYHKTVRIQDYAPQLREMLTQLQVEYGYNTTDALLVLKDILARVWKGQM